MQYSFKDQILRKCTLLKEYSVILTTIWNESLIKQAYISTISVDFNCTFTSHACMMCVSLLHMYLREVQIDGEKQTINESYT